MGNSGSASPPPSRDVPNNKTRICIAGTTVSHHAARAHFIADKIVQLHPDTYETWYYWDSFSNYFDFIVKRFEHVPFPEHLRGHSTSPFAWVEVQRGSERVVTPIGGRSDLAAWALANVPHNDELNDLCTSEPSRCREAFGHVDAGRPPTADMSPEPAVNGDKNSSLLA